MEDEKPKYTGGGIIDQLRSQSPVYKYDPESITKEEFMGLFQKMWEHDMKEMDRRSKLKWEIPSREECDKMIDGTYVFDTPMGEMYLTKSYLLSYHDAMDSFLKKKKKK